jgi:predicted nucleic acid-binding Zn ribbon protein
MYQPQHTMLTPSSFITIGADSATITGRVKRSTHKVRNEVRVFTECMFLRFTASKIEERTLSDCVNAGTGRKNGEKTQWGRCKDKEKKKVPGHVLMSLQWTDSIFGPL